MGKNRKILQNFKIKDQILLALIFETLISCVVLGLIIYNVSKATIEENYKSSHKYNLQVSSNIIDIQLKNIIELGRSVLIDDTFTQAFTSDKRNNGSHYFSSVNSLILTRALGEIGSHEVLIDGIAVVSEEEKLLFYSKRNTLSGYYNHYYTGDSILEEGWIEEAREAKGREVFYGYNVLIPYEEGDTISFVKNLINPTTRESMGFMVMNISKKLLDKAFGTIQEGYVTNRYMIVDEDGVYPAVYFNGDETAKEGILENYLLDKNSDKYLFNSYLNESTGWLAVNVIEKEELIRDSAYIGVVILIVGFILINLNIYISRIMSNHISKPLNTLEKTIESVGEGNRHIEVEFDNSEIGEIGNKFKEMVNNNLELRERLLSAQLNQREAELLLLQAQINPHFLYNTLDSLYFMAVINHDEDIAKMVMALSNSFKLSLNKGDKFITVRDEIERIKEYMTIQNMRYNNRFDFFLDVEEEIKDIKIITFILQPFVENAMYHGLEAKIGKGYIKVIGKKVKDRLYFSIIDNGIGIKNLSVLEEGYGVKNVKERIKLFYGEGYGVSFVSEINVGTTVNIVIPADQERGKEYAQLSSY